MLLLEDTEQLALTPAVFDNLAQRGEKRSKTLSKAERVTLNILNTIGDVLNHEFPLLIKDGSHLHSAESIRFYLSQTQEGSMQGAISFHREIHRCEMSIQHGEMFFWEIGTPKEILEAFSQWKEQNL